MDFSDSPPFWPSPLGPRVPDLDTKLRKTGNPNMDTALAWLRGELVSTFCFCYRYHFSKNSHLCDIGRKYSFVVQDT